jgi:putative DNA primase/helicase
VEALKAVANVPSQAETPCWIGEATCRPEAVVAFANGLLDLDRHETTGETALLPHSPRWFSTNCLPHPFDPQAQCPHWLAFLREVFEGDQERVRALAQWFGYNLTHDNRQQKLVLLVGPPRSGKGTTMTVLTHLLGKQNVANPTLTSLGGRFGLAPLVGKQAALVPDAHLGRGSDAVAILERLKSVVGCDEQNVDRKNRAELANVRLTTRFTIAVNELPRLPDASVSLRAKMVVLPYRISFVGREDFGLSERLLAEIPGVTNWALAGLADLRRTGRLLQPQAGNEILTDFTRLSSPLSAFLEDCCEVGPDESQSTGVIFQGWALWCRENGHEVGSTTSFGTKLRAALAGVERVRVRDGESLVWHYEGLRLKDGVARRVENGLI